MSAGKYSEYTAAGEQCQDRIKEWRQFIAALKNLKYFAIPLTSNQKEDIK